MVLRISRHNCAQGLKRQKKKTTSQRDVQKLLKVNLNELPPPPSVLEKGLYVLVLFQGQSASVAIKKVIKIKCFSNNCVLPNLNSFYKKLTSFHRLSLSLGERPRLQLALIGEWTWKKKKKKAWPVQSSGPICIHISRPSKLIGVTNRWLDELWACVIMNSHDTVS